MPDPGDGVNPYRHEQGNKRTLRTDRYAKLKPEKPKPANTGN